MDYGHHILLVTSEMKPIIQIGILQREYQEIDRLDSQ